MMKKLLTLLAVLMLCMSLTACRNDDTATTEDPAEKTTEENNQSESVPKAYTVTEVSLNDHAYNISYPQLDGGDETIRKFYNKTWQALAESFVNETKANPELICNLKFRVMTQTEELLSILFTGDRTLIGGAYPSSFFFSYNVNLKTGETVTLATLPEINDIAKKLAAGDFSLPADYNYLEEFKSEIFLGYDASMLSTRLSLADYQVTLCDAGLMLAPDQYPSVFSYYENGALRIIVPVLHALGDYVTVIPN